MAADPKSIAIEALFLTLEDSLGDVLAARDSVRRARRRLRRGPYEVEAGTLEVNGQAFSLPGGTTSATSLVDEFFAASGFTATEEADGAYSRVLFASTVAPSREAPSALTFAGDEATLASLGLREVESNVAEVCAADPLPRLLAARPGSLGYVDRPWIYLEDAVSAEYRGGSVKGKIYTVRIKLSIIVPGDPSLPLEATLAKAREIDQAVAAAIEAGDSRGGFYIGGAAAGDAVIQAKPISFSAQAQAFEFRGETSTMPIGMVSPEIEVLVRRTT